MAGIWILYIVIIFVVFLVLKLVMKKQAIVTKLAFFIFITLMLTVGYVYTATGTEIKSTQDVLSFTGVYFSWVSSAFGNVKSITANAVDQDWRVKNDTKKSNG